MNPASKNPPQLASNAAVVSLLVLLLGASGLFALSYTNARSSGALTRLGAIHTAQVAAVKAQVDFKTQVQEWKDILLRGRNPADFASYRQHFEKSEASVQSGLGTVRDELAHLGLDSSPAVRLLADHQALGRSYRQALARFHPEDPASPFAVDASIRGIDRKLNQDIDALAGAVEGVATSELQRFAAAGVERYALLRKMTFFLGALAMLSALWLAFKASRVGARPR